MPLSDVQPKSIKFSKSVCVCLYVCALPASEQAY